MLNLHLSENTSKMVKNKRDLKSPRRNRSFTGSRSGPRSRQSLSSIRTTAGNIRVVIRVRPFNERENCHKNVIKVVDQHTMVFDPKEDDEPFFYHGVQQRNRDIMKRANKNLQFTFDHVFGHETTNNEIFSKSTKTLIESLMKGYNCSVFVYGATGAGKTHTMLGREEDPGITFLTLLELFKQKDELLVEREFEIGMTYLEVYNEAVQDLLNPGPALSLREDSKYGVVVSGIKMQRIEESNTLFELLEQGNRNRTQHPTDANAESSRSHAVFQVYLRMKFKTTNEIRVAKLSMIDLAGSERGAATGYSGARFTEGANINKSLLALGNCINSLADGQRHVPYRDSKLTRLLKDSLGGNCQTVMIANVSPSSFNYEDTYNTLKYAMRAKKIKSTMKKNVVNCESNLNHYIQLVEQLTKENEELKLKLSSTEKECSCKESAEGNIKVEKATETALNENVQLKEELNALYLEKKQLEQRMLQLESTKQLMQHRKQLKQETDSRLSNICTDSAEKRQCHSRIANTLSRLDRQANTIREEIIQLKKRNNSIDSKVCTILEKDAQLKAIDEIENERIMYIRTTNKVDHLQKVCDLQNGELRMRDQLIEQLSEVLKPCYLQLRGHGFATETLISKYNGLKRHFQGVRTVSWDDDAFLESDSGVSSTTVEQEDDVRGSKRKLSERPDLDNTFTISASNPKSPSSEQKVKTKVFENPPIECDTGKNTVRNVCAEGMMFKVAKQSVQDSKVPLIYRNQIQSQSKSVTAKRLMTSVSKSPYLPRTSPRIPKENKLPLQPRSIVNTRKNLDKNGIKSNNRV